MFKSKGAIAAIAVTVVAGALLLAGMGITGTSGAGTDFPGNVGGGPGYPISDGAPPQSPIEQPVVNPTNPVTDGTSPAAAPAVTNENTGGQAGANGGPNALPDAGYGPAASGNHFGVELMLLALAGVLLVGTGATAVGVTRRK